MAPFWIIGCAQPESAARETIAAKASWPIEWCGPGTGRKLAGRALGQLDARVLGMGSIQDDGMTHQPAESRAALVGDRSSGCLLVLRREESDLDEFVGEQGFVECAQNRATDARLADVDDRAQRVRESAECLALVARELRSGRRFGRIRSHNRGWSFPDIFRSVQPLGG